MQQSTHNTMRILRASPLAGEGPGERRRAQAHRLCAFALALACVVLPAPAQAITLDSLLARPIEYLLTLTVTPAPRAGGRDA